MALIGRLKWQMEVDFWLSEIIIMFNAKQTEVSINHEKDAQMTLDGIQGRGRQAGGGGGPVWSPRSPATWASTPTC